VDLLHGNGKFSVTTKVKAKKGAVYDVILYAADTNPEGEGPNKGIVDATKIKVPHDMSGKDKEKKKNKKKKNKKKK
jgi:hypothetical protein